MPVFLSRLGRKGGASAHRGLIQKYEQMLQSSKIPLPCVATRFGNRIKALRMGIIADESNKRQQMGKKKAARGALLTSNLPQLQNLIKRDPEGYKDDFLHQLNHFESIRRISQLKPGDEDHAKRFRELIGFLSQVAPCYPKESNKLPEQISFMLLQDYAVLDRDSRFALVHALVLLRSKLVITPLELLQTLFPLLPRTTSATLRSFIRKTILTDIKTANMKSKNNKMNRAAQAMMFDMVEKGMDAQVHQDSKVIMTSSASEEALWAVTLAKELWRWRVWDDAKTVSILALACLHPSIKVQSAAIHLFLGDETTDAGEIEGNFEQSARRIKSLQRKQNVKKLTLNSEKKLNKSLKALRKSTEKCASHQPSVNSPALQLLNDPQGFGEKLYNSLLRHDKRFSLDHKILHLELLSRVMGAHKLCILGFYSYIMRYLTHHQIRVTIILVSLAQSVHDLTPPDVLVPVIKKLAKEFVHPGVGSGVIAAGINAIREVSRRQPCCMDGDLLGDLIEYRKSKDKGVVVAARSLLQLYRELNPHILKRRERGKVASMYVSAELPLSSYGHLGNAPQGIEGLNLLDNYLERQREASHGQAGSVPDDDDWAGWGVESNFSDSDVSGSWIAVQSDDSGIEIGDLDEELAPDTSTTTRNAATMFIPPGREHMDMTLAMTKILTPADFAIMSQLKSSNQGSRPVAKRKIAGFEGTELGWDPTERSLLAESDILGPRKKAKADYAERMESIQRGREGREKFGSSKGKQSGIASSSTNREKIRQKPLMMVLASSAVRGKKRASIRDKQKRLRAHMERAKKAGH